MMTLVRIVFAVAVLLQWSTAFGDTFGRTTEGASVLTTENTATGFAYASGMSPTGAATGVSISCYMRFTEGAVFVTRLALFRVDSATTATLWATLVDSTYHDTIQVGLEEPPLDRWITENFYNAPSLSSSIKYFAVAWTKSGTGTAGAFYDIAGTGDTIGTEALTWTTNAWPTASTSFAYVGLSAQMSIYVTYNLTATTTKSKKWFPIGEED